LEEELRRTWAEDMLWWGPEGVGATYTIPRYARQHSGPFRAAFADRTGTGHIARLAEGHYGGFFGWPNFTARHKGGFMGLPGAEARAEFRVVDIYRREGDKLAENWIFIDILHFLKSQGVDVLGRLEAIGRA
ncbi:ester cyclase, partial [Roseicyclus sp.]|uniref:ester cyclase n=1 Tax=Roseicyclus sp. TaxID=1914329 RepID=UPI003F9FCDA6